MNILPKKRWHVRTKDNIARVRRDEAEARKKDEERSEKLQFAESEARINFLRRQRGLPERQHEEDHHPESASTTLKGVSSSSQHIDLFADYKTHVRTTNKDLEKEQKEEREKYEKQIGYLTYLGQDTNEALKLRSWYEVGPKRDKTPCNAATEKDMNNKYIQDPLTLINALLPPEKRTKVSKEVKPITIPEIHNKKEESPKPSEHKKHKKEKKSKKKKTKKEKHNERSKKKNKKSIEKALASSEQKRREQKRNLMNSLRKERLKREEAERERQDALLNPPEIKAAPDETKINNTQRIVQKYNSQFNPELAKQNML